MKVSAVVIPRKGCAWRGDQDPSGASNRAGAGWPWWRRRWLCGRHPSGRSSRRTMWPLRRARRDHPLDEDSPRVAGAGELLHALGASCLSSVARCHPLAAKAAVNVPPRHDQKAVQSNSVQTPIRAEKLQQPMVTKKPSRIADAVSAASIDRRTKVAAAGT